MRTRCDILRHHLAPLLKRAGLALGILAIGLGCESDEQPMAPADHPSRNVASEPDDPEIDALLLQYEVAFETGDVAALAALLDPTFTYEIDPDCAARISCGPSFDREAELAFLTRVIENHSERQCWIHHGQSTELPRHRWQCVVGIAMSVSDGQHGHYGSGNMDVTYGYGNDGGLVIFGMRARQWLRDDDGCDLARFRCRL